MSSDLEDFRNRSSNEQLSANDRPLTRRRRPHQTRKLVWIFSVLSFLVVLNDNFHQSFASDREFEDPYEDEPAGADDPDFEKGALKYDYLILNMQWPVTRVWRFEVEGKNVDYARLNENVKHSKYGFNIHGLWAGINGETKMGKTRVK